MPDNATPLGNGDFAVELDDWVWEIFDENGVPKGIMIFDEDWDWDWELVDWDNMIPLGNFVVPDEPPKVSPQAGDMPYMLFTPILLLVPVTGAAMRRRYARKAKPN